jgi:hypothetical protein
MMPYYTRVLQPEETVIRTGRVHWLIFWPSLFWIAIAIAIACVGEFVAQQQPQRNYCFYAAAAIGAIGLLMLFAEHLRRASTEIVVTNRRVIYKRGMLSRFTAEMNVSKIETVDVMQSLPGRLLDYGTIIVRGTGAGIEPLRNVSDPIGLRNAIMSQ